MNNDFMKLVCILIPTVVVYRRSGLDDSLLVFLTACILVWWCGFVEGAA